MSYVADMLEKENRTKKRIGSNINKATGKRGYVGKMFFPTDFMSRKEKYNYRKGGKVVSYNVYDEIKPWRELKYYKEEEQREHLFQYRQRFDNAEIAKRMGIGTGTLYGIVKRLGLPRAPKVKSDKATSPQQLESQDNIKKQSQPKHNETQVVKAAEPKEQPKEQPKEVGTTSNVSYMPVRSGLQFAFTGEHNSEKVQKQLEKLQLLLDDEENKFNVHIFVEEVAAGQ